MAEQIENKTQLKHLINAILENKRILVFRNEVQGEIDNNFILLQNYNNEDFDILSIPNVVNRLNQEKEFISYLFETEKVDINSLSNWIVEFIDYKERSCRIQGLIYGELLRLLNMLGYKASIDQTLFNRYSLSGKIKYHILLDSGKTATIVEKIEYCNKCKNDKDISIGIAKCLSYRLE